MKKRVFINLVLALLVTGLFLTVSCAQKQVASESESTKQADQKKADKDKGTAAGDATSVNPLKPVATGNPDVDFINLDIYFDFDSAELTADAQAVLQSKAGYLQKNSNINVIIEGHCDERGTTEYNLALGERRAKSAKSFLVDLGISNSRLSFISYGEEKPADPGHNEYAWERNRRGHFEIE